MFPGEEKGIVTSPGHEFELHYHILVKAWGLDKSEAAEPMHESQKYLNKTHDLLVQVGALERRNHRKRFNLLTSMSWLRGSSNCRRCTASSIG